MTATPCSIIARGFGCAIAAPPILIFAAIRRLGAGQYFDQRRLAGPVLPHESVDLPGGQVEIHSRKRGDPGIGLGDPGHLEETPGCLRGALTSHLVRPMFCLYYYLIIQAQGLSRASRRVL